MRPCFMFIFFAVIELLQHYFTVHIMKIALPSQAKIMSYSLVLLPQLILCSLLPLEFG
jgi:hypothetical protein